MKARNIAVLALVLGLHAATISRAAVAEMEYFLGDDPGEGNGNIVSISFPADTTASDLPQLTLSNNLAPGTHRIGIRVKDTAGRWSNPMFRRFTIYPSNFSVPAPSTDSTTNSIVAAEYFISTDPGPGNATGIGLTVEGSVAGTDIANPFAAAVQPGTYSLGLRFQDSAGRWGNALIRRTTIQPQEAVTTTVNNLPSGNDIPPQPASQESYLLRLAGEFHCDGVFSVSIGENSIEVPARPFETAAAFLERLALAINSDPFLSPLATAVAAGSNSLTLTATQPGLQPAGWVQTSTNLTTSITRQGTLGDEGRKIVAAEYFVGLTPSPGNGVSIPISGTDSNAAFFAEAAFTRDDLRDGPHPVGVRFKNAAGKWGQPIIRGLTSYALFETPDRTAPSILLSGSADLELAYGTPFTEPGYTATDDVDGDVTSRVVVRGQVDTGIPGTYTLQYWVDDTAGNRSSVTRDVVVTDTEQPAFIGGSDIVHTSPPATIDLFAGLRAVDPQFGDLSYSIKLTAENVDWFAPGTYTAHFEVVDPAGNKSTLSRNITLNENAVFYPAFATWIGGRSASAGASADDMLPQSDPDGDGQSNEQEWQADTDPFSKWSVLSMQYLPSANTERMRWAAMRRISYIMEASPNLIDWQDYGELVNPVDDCVLDYEFVRDSSKPRLFYRLRATPRQPLLELP